MVNGRSLPLTYNDYWTSPTLYGWNPNFDGQDSWRLSVNPYVNAIVDDSNYLINDGVYRTVAQNMGLPGIVQERLQPLPGLANGGFGGGPYTFGNLNSVFGNPPGVFTPFNPNATPQQTIDPFVLAGPPQPNFYLANAQRGYNSAAGNTAPVSSLNAGVAPQPLGRLAAAGGNAPSLAQAVPGYAATLPTAPTTAATGMSSPFGQQPMPSGLPGQTGAPSSGAISPEVQQALNQADQTINSVLAELNQMQAARGMGQTQPAMPPQTATGNPIGGPAAQNALIAQTLMSGIGQLIQEATANDPQAAQLAPMLYMMMAAMVQMLAQDGSGLPNTGMLPGGALPGSSFPGGGIGPVEPGIPGGLGPSGPSMPPPLNAPSGATGTAPQSANGAMQKLAQTAEKEAQSRNTTGRCYAGVADAVSDALGFELSGMSAYMAAPQLAQSGKFTEITQQFPTAESLKNLPAGCIVVWPKGERSPHGHISVSLGGGREASDHVGEQITNYRGVTSGFRVFMPKDGGSRQTA
jgi:hypothetical protein